jgi:hypothetical protein
LTPKGLLVMVRQRRISVRRCSGVGWVNAVKIPRPPALETAEASSAVPTYVTLHIHQLTSGGWVS